MLDDMAELHIISNCSNTIVYADSFLLRCWHLLYQFTLDCLLLT